MGEFNSPRCGSPRCSSLPQQPLRETIKGAGKFFVGLCNYFPRRTLSLKIKQLKMTTYLTRIFIATFCFTSFKTSAQKTNKPVVWYYNYFVGADTLQFNKIYFDSKNRPYKFTRFQFYTSGMELIDQDNDTIKLKDQFVLTTGTDGGHDVGTHTMSKLKNIKFDLGVDSNHNHTDPSTYAANHALSPKDPTMHWGWESGYRFWVIEGWMDENKDGKFDNRFEYHMIGDAMIRTKSLNTTGVEKEGKLLVVIDMHLDQLFDSIDFSKNNVIHGGPWDAGSEPLIKIANNSVQREVFTAGSGFNLSIPKLDNKLGMMVYPNPSNGRVTIENNKASSIKEVQVFLPNGKRVATTINRMPTNQVSLDLDPGLYWIKITDNNNQSAVIKTVVVQ